MRRVARGLVVLGIVGAVLGASKVHARYIANPPYSFHGSSRFGWSIAYMLVLLVCTYGFGLPDLPRNRRQAWAAAVGASVTAAVGMSVVQLVVGDALLPRFVVFGVAIILVPWQVICASMCQDIRSRDEDRDRILVVAEADEAERLVDELELEPEHNAVLAGSLRPAAAAGDGSVAGDDRPLVAAVTQSGATVVVLDRAAQTDDQVVAQAAALHETGVRIRTLVQFYEEWLGKLPLSELERSSLFFDIGEVHRARYARIKRGLDVALALLGMIPLVLVTPLVLIGNLFGNRGPLLYRQERVGKNESRFQILKFRTMRPNAPGALANEWTAQNDPRITPLGKVLRLTHIDELPQVVNILKGELAVVGPRPEQPRYVDELAQKLAFYHLRHLVRPGLTGWAQVKYGYAGDENDALEKLQYEFFYLRHQTLRFDLRIIGRTIRSVAGRGGR